jgi:hypothetical protein
MLHNRAGTTVDRDSIGDQNEKTLACSVIDFLMDEGVIETEDRDLFWFAETAEDIWEGLLYWYEHNGETLIEGAR